MYSQRFWLTCMKVWRAVVVRLTSALVFAWALLSHFKVLHESFFYVMGKALSDKLSCMQTDHVIAGFARLYSMYNTIFSDIWIYDSICIVWTYISFRKLLQDSRSLGPSTIDIAGRVLLCKV